MTKMVIWKIGGQIIHFMITRKEPGVLLRNLKNIRLFHKIQHTR